VGFVKFQSTNYNRNKYEKGTIWCNIKNYFALLFENITSSNGCLTLENLY